MMFILILSFLLLSVPLVSSPLSFLINFFLIGTIAGRWNLARSRFRQFIFATLFISAYLIIRLSLNLGFEFLSTVSFLASFCIFSNLKIPERYISIIFFISVGLLLYSWVFIDGRALSLRLNQDPGISYTTDMMAYLKTYLLMKNGVPFYNSFAQGIAGAFNGSLPGELWGWKQPLIFLVWSLLPYGFLIQYLAAIFFYGNVFAFYKIASKYLPLPLVFLPSVIILPYFRYPLIEQTLLQVEWWALSLFIWGLAFFINKKWVISALLFGLCLCIRELFIIPIFFVTLSQFSHKDIKKTLIFFVIIILVFIPQYLLHMYQINKFENIISLLSRADRAGVASGWGLVRTTLSYNSWSYLSYTFRPFIILLITCTFSGLFLLLNKKNVRLYLLFLSAYLPFFVISLKIGIMDSWHDYWGIYYVPLLLGVSPLILIPAYQLFTDRIGIRNKL